MQTTFNLPADLVTEIKLRAVHEGKNLEDAVADLLRKGLAVSPLDSPTAVEADEPMLAGRRQFTQKFVSGEWGLELAGYEEACEADRRKEQERAQPGASNGHVARYQRGK